MGLSAEDPSMKNRKRVVAAVIAAIGAVLVPAASTSSQSWPDDLEGPFELQALPQRTSIVMSDGVELAAWIARPALPPGLKAPVVLHSTPYLGNCSFGCNPSPDEEIWWSENTAPA